jgi:nucleotide sugar dehydrogenase
MQKQTSLITKKTQARVSKSKRANPLDPSITQGSIAVVGLGYVGLPLLLRARKNGRMVAGIDISEKRRDMIEKRAVPDLDNASELELKKGGLPISGEFKAVAESEIIIICVPTPVDATHIPDLSPVIDAATGIAKYLKPGHLVILESTVHPGTAEEIVIPLMEKESGLTLGTDFDFAHCPERINPGDPLWPVEKIPRVIGGATPRSLERAATFYRSILDANVREMGSIREAEAVKMVENSFRDVNIAFVNELAMSFNTLGIDVVNVLEGAATKPFGFMLHYPGAGVGGHCIPVDPYYLIRYAKQNGFTHRFLSLARDINNGMPLFTVRLLEEELAKKNMSLHGSTIALLGLSYKANVSDLRESPAFVIKELLLKRGAKVKAFDPFSKKDSDVHSLEDALNGADAAVIATAHNAFKTLTPKQFLAHSVGVVIDGRNCLRKELFHGCTVAYRGIGR